MRKEVNYIEEYRELWSDMKSADTTPMPEIVEWRDEMKLCLDSVSYTHLTLPTILLV